MRCDWKNLRKKLDASFYFFTEKTKTTFNTQDSRVVPHRSTDWAQQCLTSQFGWDAVYPLWFDRMMGGVGACNVLLRKKKLLKKKTFDTRDSRVVPHPSTDQAQRCLTSQFGWDAVYPPWYDRMMRPLFLCCMPTLYWSTNSEINVSIISL